MLQVYDDRHLCQGLSDSRRPWLPGLKTRRGLQYFSTHADLVNRQKEAKRAPSSNRDGMWQGDIAKETESLAVN